MLILQLKKRIEILEAQVQQLLNAQLTPTAPTLIAKEKKSLFKKPTVVEIYDYACEKLSDKDALAFTEKFHAHYEANGWKVGRNAMKDWKAAVRKWDLSTFVTTNQQTKIKNGKFDSDAAQRIYNDSQHYTKG
jgi:DNA repair ATPase RecN